MTCLKLSRPLLVFVAIFGYSLETRAADDISWYRDLKRGSEAAQKADLPMLIDFWADWCAPCKVMDSQVYTDPRVIEVFKRKVVGVRIHFDLQPDLARRFNVTGLPNLVITDSYGLALISHRGIMSAEDLLNVANAIPPLADINSLDRRLQQNTDSFADLLAMARALRGAAFFEASKGFYDRASRNDGGRTDVAARESILYEAAINLLELKDGKGASAILEKCLKDFSRSARKPEFLLALGRAYITSGMPEKARYALNSILREYPQSAAVVQARALLGSF